jgi:hypothetical protein
MPSPFGSSRGFEKEAWDRWQESSKLVRETSFSGTDISVGFVVGADGETLMADTQPALKILNVHLQTLSYSTLRSTGAVRHLGEVAPRDWTRGTRTVAGSLIFTVHQFDPLYEWWVEYQRGSQEANQPESDASAADATAGPTQSPVHRYQRTASATEKEYSSPFYEDLMPPFTILVDAATEMGQTANMAIRGVRLANTGMVLSVDDMLTEKQMTFVARDVEPFISRGEWVRKLRSKLSSYPQLSRASLVDFPFRAP